MIWKIFLAVKTVDSRRFQQRLFLKILNLVGRFVTSHNFDCPVMPCVSYHMARLSSLPAGDMWDDNRLRVLDGWTQGFSLGVCIAVRSGDFRDLSRQISFDSVGKLPEDQHWKLVAGSFDTAGRSRRAAGCVKGPAAFVSASDITAAFLSPALDQLIVESAICENTSFSNRNESCRNSQKIDLASGRKLLISQSFSSQSERTRLQIRSYLFFSIIFCRQISVIFRGRS
jgi:hypothetical protein